MKKVLSAILTSIMISIIIFSLFSCGEKSKIKALFSEINGQMDSLDSYTSKTHATFNGNGTEMAEQISCTFNDTTLFQKEENGGFIHTYNGKVAIFLGQTTLPSATVSIDQGYHDGYFFNSTTEGSSKNMIKSQMEFEDYVKYTEESGMALDFKKIPNDADTIEIEELEDKKTVITCSELSGNTMKSMKAFFATFEDMISDDFKLSDVTIEITVTEDKLVENINLSFKFKKGLNFDDSSTAKAPEFEASIKYTDLNSTIATRRDLSKYTEVDDLYYCFELENLIEKTKNASSGSFSLKLQQIIMDSTNYSTVLSINETDSVNFSNGIKGYSYDVTAEISGGSSYQMSYKEGKQSVITTTDGEASEPQTNESSDRAAKTFIDGLIDQAHFSAINVKSVEKTEKDGYTEYTVTLAVTNSAIISNLKATTGATFVTTDSEKIVFCVDDSGKLKEYNYQFSAKLKINHKTYTLKIITVCEFN